MTEPNLNFSGSIHTHTPIISNASNSQVLTEDQPVVCPTIVIFRRHPMYDCLVLTKKYRSCLKGYCLEFLTTKDSTEGSDEPDTNSSSANDPNCKRRLISKILDGDDPIIQCTTSIGAGNTELSQEHSNSIESNLSQQYSSQIEVEEDSTLIHVPINGLLNRLENYTNAGLSVDSSVYAFAMGLKTAERLLTTNSIRELQETPI